MQRGFTIIEVLLSVALLGIIAGLGMSALLSIQSQNNMAIAQDYFGGALAQAQARARAMQGDSAWGVYVDTGTITVFRGDSYAGRDEGFDTDYSISPRIEVYNTREYRFTKHSGTLPGGSTTSLRQGENTLDLEVNTLGVVTQ